MDFLDLALILRPATVSSKLLCCLTKYRRPTASFPCEMQFLRLETDILRGVNGVARVFLGWLRFRWQSVGRKGLKGVMWSWENIKKFYFGAQNTHNLPVGWLQYGTTRTFPNETNDGSKTNDLAWSFNGLYFLALHSFFPDLSNDYGSWFRLSNETRITKTQNSG